MKPTSKFGSILLLLFVWIVTSCHEDTPVLQGDPATFNRVSEWLDTQKETFKDEASQKAITDLKANLIGEQLRKEVLTEEETVIIIPLKNEFQTGGTSDDPSLKSLVLVENADHKIHISDIVEVTPKGRHYDKLPVNLISDIYSMRDCELNGTFSVLSLTNRLVYEKEFKDGKFYSLSYLKKKDNAENGRKGSGSERTKTCIDWYWQTWIDGVLMDEWYAGTTCDGECAQARHSSGRLYSVKCSNGGGGGGEGEQTWMEEETVTGNSFEVDPNGAAPKINYYYYAVVVRAKPSNQIIGVTIVNTTVTNPVATYIDQYGRGTTRYISPFNHMNTWLPLTPFTVLVSWECSVMGTWYYTDGSPEYISTWPKTRMQIHW